MQSAENEITCSLFFGQTVVCFTKVKGRIGNARVIAKVARSSAKTFRKLLGVDARLIGNLCCFARCFGIERFPQDLQCGFT